MMRSGSSRKDRGRLATAFLLWLVAMVGANAQSAGTSASAADGSYQRTFRQSKSAVEKALKELQPSLGGRLPALEGFAVTGAHPLSRYQKAYYQSTVQVSANAKGGSVVKVTAKITAWYADAIASHSGYQLLTSNGRLESDLLDELAEKLATTPGAVSPAGSGGNSDASSGATPSPAKARKPSTSESGIAGNASSEPGISAPAANPVSAGRTFSSSPSPLGKSLSAEQLREAANSKQSQDPAAGLRAEAASLEEVLKNQANPKNLVAVKKTGTPVVATPSLTGKTLFLATARDEFEMLDYNVDWVHVRISGLSRGWIWRTSLEMPEGISDIPTSAAAAPVAADLFQVTREETAPFPGDWAPLRGKNVKIISVQKIQENEKGGGAEAKLEFAKSLMDKNYADLAAKSQELSGIVMIFDSIDGGMIAATFPTVQKWKAGGMTDAALWHQCYFDPPETFTVTSSGGS